MPFTEFAVDDGPHSMDGLLLHARDGGSDRRSIHKQTGHAQMGRGAKDVLSMPCTRTLYWADVLLDHLRVDGENVKWRRDCRATTTLAPIRFAKAMSNAVSQRRCPVPWIWHSE